METFDVAKKQKRIIYEEVIAEVKANTREEALELAKKLPYYNWTLEEELDDQIYWEGEYEVIDWSE